MSGHHVDALNGQPPTPPPKPPRSSSISTAPPTGPAPAASTSTGTGAAVSLLGAAPSGSRATPTWTRPPSSMPQQFVNGRGNTQPAGPPAQFQGGQQAYIRPSPSSAPSFSNASATSPPTTFPSAFGVRQKIALKVGSRPVGPTAVGPGAGRGSVYETSSSSQGDGAGGGGGGGDRQRQLSADGTVPLVTPSFVRPSISSAPSHQHSRAAGPRLPPPPIPLPNTPSSTGVASPSMSRNSTSSLSPVSTPALSTILGKGDWSRDEGEDDSRSFVSATLSPPLDTVRAAGPRGSIMDRGRPVTPDPTKSLDHFLDGPRPDVIRGGNRRAAAGAIRSDTPESASSSVSRPKSPDPSAFLDRPPSTSSSDPTMYLERPARKTGEGASVMNRPRYKSPDPPPFENPFAFSAQPPPPTQSHPAPRSRTPDSGSVLDRPRPKTPDPFLFSARATSSPIPPPTSASPIASYHTPSASSSSAISTSILDRPRPKTPDPFQPNSSTTASASSFSVRSDPSDTYAPRASFSASRPSVDSSHSSSSRSAIVAPAPGSAPSSHPQSSDWAALGSRRSGPPKPSRIPLNASVSSVSSFASSSGGGGSGGRSAGRRSSESTVSAMGPSPSRPRFGSVAAPKLSLDFGDSLLSDSGTMFDLAGLLKVGGEPTPVKQEFKVQSKAKESNGLGVVGLSSDEGRGAAEHRANRLDEEQRRREAGEAQWAANRLKFERESEIREEEEEEGDEQPGTSPLLTTSETKPSFDGGATPRSLDTERLSSEEDREANSKKERKRSLSSLLSRSSDAAIVAKDQNPTDSLNQSDSLHHSGSYPSQHEFSASPALSSSTSTDQLSRASSSQSLTLPQHQHQHQHQPSLPPQHQHFHRDSSPGATPPPSRTAPLHTQSSEKTSQAQAKNKSLPPTPTPLTQNPPSTTTSPGKIQRQLSKLRPSRQSDSGFSRDTGFQLVSATTTRKGFFKSIKAQPASTSSVETESIAGRNDSSTPPPAASSPPRRKSLAGMLNGVTERKGSMGSILGMSLPAGRKSEDLLSMSGPLAKDDETTPTKPSPVKRRGSFDLLTQKSEFPRRPSTDQLLNFATAKLSTLNFATPEQSSEDTENQPSASTSALSHGHGDSTSASASPSSYDHHDPHSLERASVTVATRVNRSGSIPSEDDTTALSARSVVSPVLVRRESLSQSNAAVSVALGSMAVPATQPAIQQVAQPVPSSPAIQKAPPLVQPLPWRKKEKKIPDSGVGSDASMSNAWLDLEDTLALYASAVAENRPDRGGIITNVLLPFLRREEDSPSGRVGLQLGIRQRTILFRWLATLVDELRGMQPAHRGACLEAVAAIAESHFLSASVLENDPAGASLYRSSIVNILSFAVEKLNDKAVYANTLVFSGRVFALAFFRIEGVALKLLRALPPVKRQYLMRVMEEAEMDEKDLPSVDLEAFPPHVWNLCLRDLKAYSALLLPVGPQRNVDDRVLVQDGSLVVEMSGNWLIRFTASDSDLPFAFYRAYHRQLAAHLVPSEYRDDIRDLPALHPSQVLTGPGALFLAASLLEKSDALVHRNLRSVTSIGPNNSNFNTNDSANLNFGQKPKVLELANRRLVSTMLEIVGGPPPASNADPTEVAADSETRRYAFSRLLRVWIRSCVKRTSMWDTRSVFILMDLIEGLIYTLSYPVPTARGSEEEVVVPKPHMSCIEMFDIPFIFSFVKIILKTADNTVAIMRTIAFVYAHFEIFTMRPFDRDELCERVILDEELFSRMYLHWNAGVRGYFIRLLVWRLARLGIVAQEQNPNAPRDPQILNIFAILNLRLEAIRKRHDELEPSQNLVDADVFKPKRSTICSTRGVKEMPFTVDELSMPVALDESDDEDVEPQELVRILHSKKGPRKEVATVARVVSWLKGGLGKSSKGKNGRSPAPESAIQPFIVDNPSPSQELEDPFDYPDSPPPPPPPTEPTNPPRRRPSRPKSASFFNFEFEGGMAPTDPAPPSPVPSSASIKSNQSGDTTFPMSPTRRTELGAPSPRVSLRFSKRISILPPAALDVLKELGEAVPPIPAQYLSKSPTYYDKRLHPYAIRGLRDYEDALDEWTDWVTRLQEEEEDGKKHNKGFMDIVPRLSVAWPQSFEDS